MFRLKSKEIILFTYSFFLHSKDCYNSNYKYSWSFYLVGISSVFEKTSAVISIKLYLERNVHKLNIFSDILRGLENSLNELKTEFTETDSKFGDTDILFSVIEVHL